VKFLSNEVSRRFKRGGVSRLVSATVRNYWMEYWYAICKKQIVIKLVQSIYQSQPRINAIGSRYNEFVTPCQRGFRAETALLGHLAVLWWTTLVSLRDLLVFSPHFC